jgi:3-oxoacyl-[acyl-carrier protein] reductase
MNIVITGASRGIGLEITRQAVALGEHKVIALSRNSIDITDSPSYLQKMQFDIARADQIPGLLNRVRDFFEGKVDILINNAGILINKPFKETTDEEFDQVYEVNTKGPFRLIRGLLPWFAKPAHILNISSMGGYQGSAKFPGLSAYSSSKGALAILTECLAEELKPREIAVNALALAAVNTEMLKEAFPGYQAKVSAAEMAEYILDFALKGNRVFNGKILPVSLSVP